MEEATQAAHTKLPKGVIVLLVVLKMSWGDLLCIWLRTGKTDSWILWKSQPKVSKDIRGFSCSTSDA